MSDLVLPEAAELEVVPAEDGEEPGGGGEPRQPDHHQRALLRPAPQVAQRRGDGPVPGIALFSSSSSIYWGYQVCTGITFMR